jgi:HK97 family phage major capsid protein
MGRLEQIEARISAIKDDIEKRGSNLTSAETDAYLVEVEKLDEEKRTIIAEQEKRNAIIDKISSGQADTTTVTQRNFSPQAGGNKNNDNIDDVFATDGYRKAFKEFVTRNTAIPQEYRANQTTFTTDVGAVIPTTVLNKIVEKIESTGKILSLVTRTAFKGGLSVPYSSVKPVATWVAEGSGSDTQKKIIGSITFNYFKLRCAVAMSLEVETMSISAFETTIIQNIVEAMTKQLENSIINGTGSGQPKGILSETPISTITISTSPSYENICAAEAAVPIEYDNSAVWCMTKSAIIAFQSITDNGGQPILRTAINSNGKFEHVILGRPVALCNYSTIT